MNNKYPSKIKQYIVLMKRTEEIIVWNPRLESVMFNKYLMMKLWFNHEFYGNWYVQSNVS